jgi:hypothetical protein
LAKVWVKVLVEIEYCIHFRILGNSSLASIRTPLDSLQKNDHTQAVSIVLALVTFFTMRNVLLFSHFDRLADLRGTHGKNRDLDKVGADFRDQSAHGNRR